MYLSYDMFVIRSCGILGKCKDCEPSPLVNTYLVLTPALINYSIGCIYSIWIGHKVLGAIESSTEASLQILYIQPQSWMSKSIIYSIIHSDKN